MGTPQNTKRRCKAGGRVFYGEEELPTEAGVNTERGVYGSCSGATTRERL